MSKREFVEQAAMRILARVGPSATDDQGYSAKAVRASLMLWDEIEKQVPRDKNLDLLGGSRQ